MCVCVRVCIVGFTVESHPLAAIAQELLDLVPSERGKGPAAGHWACFLIGLSFGYRAGAKKKKKKKGIEGKQEEPLSCGSRLRLS